MTNTKDSKSAVDKRKKKDRRYNDGSRREEIRWEPEKEPRRKVTDRRNSETNWPTK